MFKSKIRNQQVSKTTEDKFYETVFLVVVEKTVSARRNTKALLHKWAEFTDTNEELLERALYKLKLSSYTRMKYFKMKALAYFGVTVKDIKNIFGYAANYARIPDTKGFYTFTVCNEEEIVEIRKLLDRLIYLLWLFKYVKFDENGIVLKEYKDYNKKRICELFMRTSLFYFRKRYQKVFPDSTIKSNVAIAKLLDMFPMEVDFVSKKINTFNNTINLGEMRSLLYYAFGISIKDAKEMLQYKQPSLYYIHKKYEDRTYNSVLNDNEFDVVKKFLRNIYENTKYISYLKGVDKDE